VPHANDGVQLQFTPLLAVSFDTMAAIFAVAPSSNVAGGAAAKVTAIDCGCVPPPPPDEEPPPPPHPAATTKIPSVTRRSGILMAIPLKSARDFWPGFSSPYDTHSPSFSNRLSPPQFPKALQSRRTAPLSAWPVPPTSCFPQFTTLLLCRRFPFPCSCYLPYRFFILNRLRRTR
jgi:hypothetical protein